MEYLNHLVSEINSVLWGVFFLVPLVLSIAFSFTDFDGWKTMNFIGVKNYINLFKDNNFWGALGRTFVYTLFSLPFKVIIPLLIAALLCSDRVVGKGFARTLVYIPVLLSSLVVGITINWMFSAEYGLVNYLITSLGGTRLEWALNPYLATFVISFASNWASTGFYMIIFIGGIRRIASFAEKMVPVMALVYIIGSCTIIFGNADMIWPALKSIIVGAFDPEAATGGIIGASIKEAIRYGVARGLFSNEAGMGSTPHAHALARVQHPVQQGLAAIVGLTIDTFVVLNMTAFVILCTGALDGQTTGITLTQRAFTLGLGAIGPAFVAICLLFFAFTTIIGWYFFAEQNVKYLFGLRWVQSYRVLVLCFLMAGSFLHVSFVWELADFFNGLMVIPNVIALLALSKLVAKALDDYEGKFLLGETPEYGALSPNNEIPYAEPPVRRKKGQRRSIFRRRRDEDVCDVRSDEAPLHEEDVDSDKDPFSVDRRLKEDGIDRF